MSWRTYRITVELRNLGRRVGANRLLGRLVSRCGYETSFQDAILGATRNGDCAWDIGANVGLYTLQLAQKVGAKGQVIAFEPDPLNRERLESAVKTQTNVTVQPFALGDCDAVMQLERGLDSLGATSRIVFDTKSPATDTILVRVARGDDLVAAAAVPRPNVIKIDTEGFEVDVLRGLMNVLRSPELRALFIEVHFGLLQERGLHDGPKEVERLIAQAGFRCRWTDPSHVVALRAS